MWKYEVLVVAYCFYTIINGLKAKSGFAVAFTFLFQAAEMLNLLCIINLYVFSMYRYSIVVWVTLERAGFDALPICQHRI